jgi:uncharacterized membrane protein
MAKLSDAKILGGIGSILMLLSIVHFTFAIVGLILLLIAVKFVSDITGDQDIFKNMLYAVIIGIVGIVAAFFVFLILFSVATVSTASVFGVAPSFNPSEIGGGATNSILGLIGGFLAGMAVPWIAFLVSAIFARRSYNGLASRLGIKIFDTAGLLYLIGAALVIVLVGFILIFVTVILTIIGFFSIHEQPQQVQPSIQ